LETEFQKFEQRFENESKKLQEIQENKINIMRNELQLINSEKNM